MIQKRSHRHYNCLQVYSHLGYGLSFLSEDFCSVREIGPGLSLLMRTREAEMSEYMMEGVGRFSALHFEFCQVSLHAVWEQLEMRGYHTQLLIEYIFCIAALKC